ncbi:hypothetical protein V6x_51560 [Gimesia chilikensis]|uniref:Type II toxin-antitoxin system RelE/ParE family toxin n=1 Tax=Gimesia chilikensis TaxID=2605989 RepID=A0A517WJJ9_9PLAN|nr:hypothetical protein [Gimesia chilikensis]QDU05419.1 hypothetical protein V6x_51560 [Gimesia chilikensis]
MDDAISRLKTVVVLPCAVKEAKKILGNEGKYFHIVEIVKRLVHFGDRNELWDLRIDSIGDFYELKLKGHLLGKVNLRIYFAELEDSGEIVVLKSYKKEDEHQTPRHIVINLEHRLEEYIKKSDQERLIIYHKIEMDL